MPSNTGSIELTRRQFLGGCAVIGAVGAGAYLMGPGFLTGDRKDLTQASLDLDEYSIKAMDYDQLGDRVECLLCPHDCVLNEGERGKCQVRENVKGTLVSRVFGNPCAIHVDPIEKKPLFHFLPGTKAYSIATAGCNLRCLNCQNWQISQFPPEKTKNADMPPEKVVEKAIGSGSATIAYTYSEPIVFYEYAYETSKLARDRGIKNVLVTAGYINEEPLRRISKVIDGANVDLKSFNDDIYSELIGARLDPVLNTLKTLVAEGVWLEITNLVVPTWTDDLSMIADMCKWLKKNIGPDYPLHFSRFTPRYKLQKLAPTPIKILVDAQKIAMDAGLNHVYVGNAPQLKMEDTICPDCGRSVVKRRGYLVTENNIDKGNCRFCGEPIAGVWE